MEDNNDFEKYLETHCSSITKKFNSNFININMEEKCVHKSKKTAKYYLISVAILACFLLGGWSYISSVFHDRAVNDSSPIELEAQGKISKPNISMKYKNLTLTVKGVLAEKERTLIVLEGTNSKSDIQYTHLIDAKGNVYNLKRWGGGTLSTSKSSNEIELEFEGLPLDSSSTTIVFNKLNGEDGEWKLTVPVNVLKPVELNTNIVSKKDDAVIKIKNVCFSGSLVKISGNISKEDGTWAERFHPAYLKLNDKKLLEASEIYFNRNGDFFILFSSTVMDGPLDVILEWNENKKMEISIPSK